MPTIYHRIVKSAHPSARDFLSYELLGIPLPPNPTDEQIRIHSGTSVYATEAQARRKARGIPSLGRFIAVLEIPDDASVRAERTTNSGGHYTLWGQAESLVSYVTSVVPV
jgi:hypothetical protein